MDWLSATDTALFWAAVASALVLVVWLASPRLRGPAAAALLGGGAAALVVALVVGLLGPAVFLDRHENPQGFLFLALYAADVAFLLVAWVLFARRRRSRLAT